MNVTHYIKISFALILLIVNSAMAAKVTDKKASERASIGSTFSSPVAFEGSLYFLSTAGVLFKSKMDLSEPKPVFEGKKQTFSDLAIDDSILYWGEGVHSDKTSTFRAYDLKAKKMLKEITVDGHVERGALVYNGILYLGIGAGGMAALKVKTLEKVWQTKSAASKPLHIDGNVVQLEKRICTTSIYEFKAVVCFESSTGKVLNTFELKKNPKSEISKSGGVIAGFATEANLSEPKWNTVSDFYVIDLLKNKIIVQKELRGFNFFAPLLNEDLAYVTLSTGDFITVSLKTGAIGYIGEYAEPFINNPFIYKNNFCALGVMGKFMCYSRNKNGFGIANDSRIFETPIGKITTIDGKIYAPSRIGYFIVE